MKYLLDTQIMVWAIESPSRLSKRVSEVLFNTNAIYVSIESLRELIMKKHSNEIAIKYSLEMFCDSLKDFGVKIVNTEINHIKTLNELTAQKNHKDPFDHLLISIAISGKFIFISSDQKFPFYRNQGLELIEH